MVVEPAPRLSMRRPNALLLRDQHSNELVYLAFESREEKQQWMGTIQPLLMSADFLKIYVLINYNSGNTGTYCVPEND